MEEVDGQNPGMNQNPNGMNPQENQENSGSGKKWLIIGISALVIILIAAGIWWMFFTGDSGAVNVDSNEEIGGIEGAGAVENDSESDNGVMNDSEMNESSGDSTTNETSDNETSTNSTETLSNETTDAGTINDSA